MKDTKKRLLSSIATLFVCFAMLIGSTYAWFTDSASTGVNKIQAGNLDVQLLMWDETERDYVDISNDTTPIFGSERSIVAKNNNADTLWEPGKTQVAYLAIKNNGNLALKYKVALDVDNVSKNLYEVMEYTITPDATSTYPVTAWTSGNSVVEGTQNVSTDVSLPVDATHYFALSVHMKEGAGNEYQGGKVNFDLTVLATQDTVENDSFNNQYDKDAEYPAITVGTTLDDVFTGLTDKDGNGVDFGVNAPAKDVSVNGQGIATVTGFADAWVAGDVTIKGVKFLNGACFTAKENGTVGTLTLEDCTFYACDQSKIDLAPYAYNSLKNSGDGLCLNVDTKDSPNLKVVIKNCRFIGENDPTLNRDGWKDIGGTNWDPDTAVKNKSRGHAVMINGICGGGNNATAESVLIEGCTMDGIRGHAIQLYKLRMGVTVKDCTINSWGNNAQTAAGTKSDAAIRGDIENGSGGNLTVTNTRFGLNESTSLRHINVDNYSGNTNGSRVAGTY